MEGSQKEYYVYAFDNVDNYGRPLSKALRFVNSVFADIEDDANIAKYLFGITKWKTAGRKILQDVSYYNVQ